MTSSVGTPFVVLVILVGAIVALLVLLTRSVRAARALRQREERVRLVADRAPVMIWTARPDTTLDYLNTTWARIVLVTVHSDLILVEAGLAAGALG
jgi:PAS domain-containing protein